MVVVEVVVCVMLKKKLLTVRCVVKPFRRLQYDVIHRVVLDAGTVSDAAACAARRE